MAVVFTGSVINLVGGAAFTALLGWACVSDLRTRRIPNRLVLMLMVGGLLFSVLGHSGGPASAAFGVLVGLALWLPVYALGVLGAGDVKLFAAAAAWLGPQGALEAALLAALAGGVLAVFMVAASGSIRDLLQSVTLRLATRQWRPAHPAVAAHATTPLPYGIALATGALLAGWLPTLAW